LYVSASFAEATETSGAGDDGGSGGASFALERRLPDENERLEGRVSAGTRKEATEQEAAVPRLDVRNACVRALRKHVCAVLIEGWRRWRESECCPYVSAVNFLAKTLVMPSTMRGALAGRGQGLSSRCLNIALASDLTRQTRKQPASTTRTIIL
jgi:hypothetical protein